MLHPHRLPYSPHIDIALTELNFAYTMLNFGQKGEGDHFRKYLRLPLLFFSGTVAIMG